MERRSARRASPLAARQVPFLSRLEDDEPLVGNVIRKALAPHDVTIVETVKRGIEALESQKFSCIICDLMLTDAGGEVFYRRLIEHDPRYADRMAFMTGGAFTPSARSFFESVKAPRLEKPDLGAEPRADVHLARAHDRLLTVRVLHRTEAKRDDRWGKRPRLPASEAEGH